ncbi:MAG: acylphosphatase [Fuerstiella sp.]|nr:acylphosphatase [Fuerstiella sp.]
MEVTSPREREAIEPTQQVTKRILVTGNVQGVGFRWTTNRIAAGHPVTGFVRNLSDGRVELVVSGNEEAAADLILDVCEHFQDMIVSITEESIQLPKTIHDFTIRR